MPPPPASSGAGKNPDALRTISEVAAELGVAQHVLRFWETRFPDLKPMKRSGNRRYYRPHDVELAAALHQLLHRDGYTVKGVQKLIATHGARNLPALAAAGPVLPEADATAKATAVATAAPTGDAGDAGDPVRLAELRRLRQLLVEALGR